MDTTQHNSDAAITQALGAGFVPARWQRELDWNTVTVWVERVQETNFTWREQDDYNTDAIVIGPAIGGGWAIHAGQHRILGGLLGGNPVPLTAMTVIETADPGKTWRAESRVGGGFTINDLMYTLAQ